MLSFFTNTLRGKILFGFIIILTIMIFVTFWSIYNFYRLNESFKQTIYENYTSIIAVDNMDKALDEQLNAVIMMLNNDAEAGKLRFENAKQDFYFWYDNALQSAFTNDEKVVLDSLNSSYKILASDFLFKIDPEKVNNFDQITRTEYFISITTILKQIRKETYKLSAINHNYIEGVGNKVNNITSTATIFMVLIILAGAAIGLIFSSRFSNYITKPLQNLTSTIGQIAKGNFEERLEINEEDEIGNLAAEFNKMSEKLAFFEKMNLQKIVYEKKKSEVVLENINEPVVVIDRHRSVLLVNQMFRKIFGDHDYEGRKIDTIIEQEAIFSELEKAIREKTGEKELLLILKDLNNNELYFNIVPSAINLPEEGSEGIVLVFNNITRLKELDRMKNEFIGKVSHELKTPLTSIGMAVGLLEESLTAPLSRKQHELILSMKEDYNRLNKLVIEILELSKLESGKLQTDLFKLDARTLVEDIVKKLRLHNSLKTIDFTVLPSEKGYFIEANPDLLKRAVENILSNSIKFTKEHGKIDISLSHSAGTISLVIRDDGIGLKEEDIPRIFDKFVQVKEGVPGSVGLGLTIAKEIIELHNGTIEVESHPGKDTSFKIVLPESSI